MNAPNPVVVREVETRLICPAELDRDPGDMPQPEAGAILTHNDAGGRYFDAIVLWSLGVLDLFKDAQAACPPPGQ